VPVGVPTFLDTVAAVPRPPGRLTVDLQDTAHTLCDERNRSGVYLTIRSPKHQ
jgi:hypothetical protein